MATPVLNREQATERLSVCATEIRSLGVARLALFGRIGPAWSPERRQ